MDAHGLTFLFLIFILILDLFPSTQLVGLAWNFSLLIPAYQSAVTKRYSSSSSALPLFLRFSVLPKINTQVYSFNLNYIYFSLLHTFTALYSCLMGWEGHVFFYDFSNQPLFRPFSAIYLILIGHLFSLNLSHRNIWCSGVQNGWFSLFFFFF